MAKKRAFGAVEDDRAMCKRAEVHAQKFIFAFKRGNRVCAGDAAENVKMVKAAQRLAQSGDCSNAFMLLKKFDRTCPNVRKDGSVFRTFQGLAGSGSRSSKASRQDMAAHARGKGQQALRIERREFESSRTKAANARADRFRAARKKKR